MKIGEQTVLIKFIKIAMNAASKILPAYSSKFSRRDFSQHQMLVTLLIKRFFGLSYRDVVDLLASSRDLAGLIGFWRWVPSYSTLQKFFKRLAYEVWNNLFEQVLQVLKWPLENNRAWGADSTGYRLTQASPQYLESHWNSPSRGKAPPPVEKMKPRWFAKHIFLVELRGLLMGAQQVLRGPYGDMGQLVPLLKQRAPWIHVKAIAADAGFDTMAAHRWVRSRLHAKDAVKLARRRGSGDRIHPYRRMLSHYFPKTFYRQRAKVEAVPSIIKRKFGSFILTRLPQLVLNETVMLGAIYNVYRGIMLGLLPYSTTA